MSTPPTPQSSARTRSRLTLVCIAAAFLAPILAAVFLNSRWTDWQPPATRNYGTLLEPVAPLPAALRSEFAVSGHWTLIATERACGGDCAAMLDLLDRLHRAMGRHGEDLREVLVSDLDPGAAAAGPVIVVPGSAGWERFLAELPSAAGAVLVDPLGNVMMTYPVAFDAGRVRRDLDRLLRYSKFDAS